MAYGNDLKLINCIIVHQANRQKIVGGGLTSHLKELFYYAEAIHNGSQNNELLYQTAVALAKLRYLTAKLKLAELQSSKIDSMTLLEKRALLTEIAEQVALGEELLNG